MNGHAPWLAGSSCTQRSSSTFVETAELFAHLLRRERVKPLDRDDRELAVLSGLAPRIHQVPAHLARAEQH